MSKAVDMPTIRSGERGRALDLSDAAARYFFDTTLRIDFLPIPGPPLRCSPGYCPVAPLALKNTYFEEFIKKG
jgi:hypothetical protein